MTDISFHGVASFLYFTAFLGMAGLALLIFILLAWLKRKDFEKGENIYWRYAGPPFFCVLGGSLGLFVIETSHQINFLKKMDAGLSLLVIALILMGSFWMNKKIFKKR